MGLDISELFECNELLSDTIKSTAFSYHLCERRPADLEIRVTRFCFKTYGELNRVGLGEIVKK